MRLPAGTEKRAVVEAMFDRIAARYDLMNRVMTFGVDRGWRRRTIAALDLRGGERVLDLACGSGDLAAEAARRGARVIALDFSRAMLRRARTRRIDCVLVRGDALALPLADASVDAVVSGFALRNFVDLDTAVRECARVVRPAGRLAFLEVDRPQSVILRAGHALYFRWVMPLLGALLVESNAYTYLAASTRYLPNEPHLVAMLGRAGFEAIVKRQFLGGAAQLLTGRRAAAPYAHLRGASGQCVGAPDAPTGDAKSRRIRDAPANA
jgi:demethylmenaquinone methyltransferase/2-methoxy-6-polyprenyl-1,4-benzoquinol methylase